MGGLTRGEVLLATEGLALARLAYGGDAAQRQARVGEIRGLLETYDRAELGQTLSIAEYGLVDGYERWSETYDRPLRLFPIEEPVVHGLLAGLPPGSLVLDAACGTGRHAAWLSSRGHQVVGVDCSSAMLGRARAKLPGCRWEEGDLARLPLLDASVDAAVCGLALVHLPDLRPAFAELARVVRPGGRIVVSDVHPFLVALGWQAQFTAADGGHGLIRLNSHLAADYAAAALAAGLRITGLHEPLLTPDSAVTIAQAVLPEANRAAWAGLPGVIVWDLLRPQD